MAGHSQFKNIMHRKGKQDAVRAKLFSKLGREITVAAKMGMPDPAMNPRLRMAVLAARAENMPKDNIQRAINKAAGGEGDNYDEVRYEGYGPGGAAVIVEALTDNRNRTASAVRSYFTKAGGAMGESNSVSFMFNRVGEIAYPLAAGDADKLLEAALGAPASAKPVWRPTTSAPLDEEKAASMMRLMEALDNDDDVQNVFANYEISDEVMAKLG